MNAQRESPALLRALDARLKRLNDEFWRILKLEDGHPERSIVTRIILWAGVGVLVAGAVLLWVQP